MALFLASSTCSCLLKYTLFPLPSSCGELAQLHSFLSLSHSTNVRRIYCIARVVLDTGFTSMTKVMILSSRSLELGCGKDKKKKGYWGIARRMSLVEEIRGHLSHNWEGDGQCLNIHICTHIEHMTCDYITYNIYVLGIPENRNNMQNIWLEVRMNTKIPNSHEQSRFLTQA